MNKSFWDRHWGPVFIVCTTVGGIVMLVGQALVYSRDREDLHTFGWMVAGIGIFIAFLPTTQMLFKPLFTAWRGKTMRERSLKILEFKGMKLAELEDGSWNLQHDCKILNFEKPKDMEALITLLQEALKRDSGAEK